MSIVNNEKDLLKTKIMVILFLKPNLLIFFIYKLSLMD